MVNEMHVWNTLTTLTQNAHDQLQTDGPVYLHKSKKDTKIKF